MLVSQALWLRCLQNSCLLLKKCNRSGGGIVIHRERWKHNLEGFVPIQRSIWFSSNIFVQQHTNPRTTADIGCLIFNNFDQSPPTRAHTLTYTHARAHGHTPNISHTRTHAHLRKRADTHFKVTHKLTHTHTFTHPHTQSHSLTHALTHSHTHNHTHWLTHTLTHTHTHTHNNTLTHTLTLAHQHTLTHTHTHILTD